MGAFAPPQPTEIFSDSTPVEAVTKFEALKGKIGQALVKGYQDKQAGDVMFVPKFGIVKSERRQVQDLLAKYGSTLDVASINKEWELGTPIPTTAVQSTGITPYNVEDGLLMVVAKELQLRNSTPRETRQGGQGIEFRRLTSVSNSGGSSANLSTFFSSTSNTATVNGVTFNIPALISYTGDTTYKSFVEQGLSDAVSMEQQFAAQGFVDANAVSTLALLWADMLGEERNILNAVSTAINIGSAAATAAADATATSAGLPSATATAVYVTFSNSYGESKAITATGTPTTSGVIGIKLSALTNVPAETLAVNIYANYSGTYYKGTTVFTVAGAYGAGASPATFAVVTALPSTSVDNGSANTLGYDGMIQEYNNSALGGYQLALNAALSTSTPGTELTTLLETLYVQQAADPDVFYTTGSIAKRLFDLLAGNSSTNGYRVTVASGDGSVVLGGAVTGVVNPTTSKTVPVRTHRFMPQGVIVAHQASAPYADSGITAPMKIVNCVDTMVIDWPQISMAYIRSTYRYGTLIFEAPVWSGVITNVFN